MIQFSCFSCVVRPFLWHQGQGHLPVSSSNIKVTYKKNPKNLTSAVTFEWYVTELSYLTCVFHVFRHFVRSVSSAKVKVKYQGHICQKHLNISHKV